MSQELDAILRRVAAGDLTPEQALPLIDAVQAAAAPPTRPADPLAAGPAAEGGGPLDEEPAGSRAGSGSAPHWGTPASGPAPTAGAPESVAPGRESDGGRIALVRIAVSYRSIDVIADGSVDQIAVTGAHTVRREGDVLVVESLQLPGFARLDEVRPDGGGGGRWAFASLPRSLAWARAMNNEHLTVRINPRLPIEVDTTASSLRVSGCEGGARIRLVAASLKADRLRGQLEIEALTSSVKGSAAITGTSRLLCESSSLKLVLLPGTDVRAQAVNRLGKVVLSSHVSKGGFHDGEVTQTVLGDGTGQLTVEATMSSVVLTEDAAVRARARA